jgi:hypothetical protein
MCDEISIKFHFIREKSGYERIYTLYLTILQKRREVPVDARKCAYFRHKVGVNSTKIVKTSNRPSNMAAEHTQVWNTLSTP